MLTPVRVEAEMGRLIEEAEKCAHEIAERAEVDARARVTYKIAYAKALLRTKGTVAVREAEAVLAVQDELLEQEIAHAHLMATQEKARTIRSSLDALRSVNANLRFATGSDF